MIVQNFTIPYFHDLIPGKYVITLWGNVWNVYFISLTKSKYISSKGLVGKRLESDWL